MTGKSLFNIILKILGVYFLKDLIIAIPTFLSSFYIFQEGDGAYAIGTFLMATLTLLIYAVAIFYLVIKTDVVIEKLKLVERLPEDPLPLNIHRSTVLSIAVMIVAVYMITQAIPSLVRALGKWYIYSQQSKSLYTMDDFDYSMILVYSAEIITGLLLIGYQETIVKYIEYRQRKTNKREPNL